MNNLVVLADKELADAVKLRRAIHADPEIGLHLPKTKDKILGYLKGLPLEIRESKTTSGIIAILRGNLPGKTVLLRGDMDALPLVEESGLAFASKGETMHACGHDLHVAMLAGAVKVLCQLRDKINGSVVFMFQPGEEGQHGAKFMLDEPGLIPAQVDCVFGIHVTTNIPAGCFATRVGPMMASVDNFVITVTGKGGHAALPWHAIDPLPAACHIALGLHSIVTRRFSPMETPLVVTVGKVTHGTTQNIIPRDTVLTGTIRAFSEDSRNKAREEVQRVAEYTAQAHQCTATVKLERGYPVTVNHEKPTKLVEATVKSLFGAESFKEMPPITGAEDFAYVLQKFPGNFVFLGTPVGDHATAAGNHSEKVIFDDKWMSRGITLNCAMAFAMLQNQSAKL